MIILIRILLVLLPVVGLIFWLRTRARRQAGGEISDEDVKHLQMGLAGLVVLLIFAAVGISLTDTSGSTEGRYVPARVENGKTIPAHFEEIIPAESKAPKEADTPENRDDNNDSDHRDHSDKSPS